MGDRQTFQVMPSPDADEPEADRDERALAFRHDNEIAKPYRYGVEFENGMRTDIAPTDHAALFRFEFTGDSGNVILDNIDRDEGDSGLTIDEDDGTISGWSDVASGLSNGAGRLFVWGTFDREVTQSGMLPNDDRDSTGYVKFDTSADKVVNLRIATSLMSVNQARRNLELEIKPTDTFATLAGRAQGQWDDKLDVIEVEGATPDQSRTLYSNLYRLSLYPNSAHENVGSAASPEWKHAVQSSTDSPPATESETGAEIADGKVYVNNGFWDTYRTVWAGYALFDPATAGELIDGFVEQYRDGGWVARWSSPGYANLMTGTSSDVAFADAYVKGSRASTRRTPTTRRSGTPPWRRRVRTPTTPTSAARGSRPRCSSATRRRACPRASPGRSRATSTTTASATWRRRWRRARAGPTSSGSGRSRSTSSAAPPTT